MVRIRCVTLMMPMFLKLNGEKVIRGKKPRIDTTAVELDIHHSTDMGRLLMVSG